jgi:hypothetical protein
MIGKPDVLGGTLISLPEGHTSDPPITYSSLLYEFKRGQHSIEIKNERLFGQVNILFESIFPFGISHLIYGFLCGTITKSITNINNMSISILHKDMRPPSDS